MLKDLFDQTHFHHFPPNAGPEERDAMLSAIETMIAQSNVETSYRVTDEGIAFGFTDQESADMLRLNLMAIDGDFGAHTHTQVFDNPVDQADYAAIATHAAAALGITLDMRVQGQEVVLDFERSEDAVIFGQVMDIAATESLEEAVKHGQFMKGHMRDLRAQLTTLSI